MAAEGGAGACQADEGSDTYGDTTVAANPPTALVLHQQYFQLRNHLTSHPRGGQEQDPRTHQPHPCPETCGSCVGRMLGLPRARQEAATSAKSHVCLDNKPLAALCR